MGEIVQPQTHRRGHIKRHLSKEKPPEIKISLRTNSMLDIIIEGLGQIEPNWDELYNTLTFSQRKRIAGYTNGDLLSRLAEIHVANTMKSLADGIPEINLNPFLDGQEETSSYRFQQAEHNLFIYKRGHDKPEIEYDGFAVVNGLPTILEVKLGYTFPQAIRRDRINKIAKPLLELFGNGKLAYVIVAPAGLNLENPSLKLFTDAGGAIVKIPATKHKFEAEIQFAKGYNSLPALGRT